MTYRWIDSSDEVAGYVERVLAEPRYALDTEFHRERTYFPKLALVQIAAAGEIVLIDPLACDLSPLKLLPSLVSLLQSELRVTAGKGDRLTDWLRRPLSADQRDYAASDVAHLLQLQDTLDVKLAAEGRAEWVADACEELRTRPVSGTEPDLAWTRLKDVRVLKPRARGVARAVAAWRERRAMAIDSPVRQVLPDLAILGISQKQPTTVAELGQCRGVDDRHTRGVIATDILAAVREGMANEASMPAGDGEELDRSLRPAVTLVSAWVSEVARQRRIDTALLATRNDLVAFLRGGLSLIDITPP